MHVLNCNKYCQIALQNPCRNLHSHHQWIKVSISLYLLNYLFIYLFIFGSVGSSFLCEGFLQLRRAGATFITVRGPFTIAASLVAENRLQTRRLSSCGSRAQLVRGMWDPPGPGLEPVSPALAGRLPTTAPPGKPCIF